MKRILSLLFLLTALTGQAQLRALHKAPAIANLIDRKLAEMPAGISTGDVQSVYRGLPALVRDQASMIFIPSHFKAGKLYGLQAQPVKNLLMYSEKFESSAWQKISTTVTPNAALAPDGTMTMDKVVATAGYMNNTAAINVPIGTFVTASIYVKDAGGGTLIMGMHNASSNETLDININTTNGTATAVASYPANSISYLITSLGNGIYRCSVTGKFTKNNYLYMFLQGTGAAGAYIWGAQFERGTVATAYQATNAGENLFKYSEQLDNAVWSRNANVSITTNADVAPDGTMSAELVNATANGYYLMNSINNPVIGQTYTFSFYAKAGTNTTNLRASLRDQTGVTIGSELVYQTLINSSTWTRLSITVTIPSGVTVLQARVYTDGDLGTVYIWGAQLNYGSAALPYTKTTYSNTDGWVNNTDFTFSRGSNATVVGADGLVQYAPHNLLQRSEELDNAYWTKNSATVSANAVIAPDGTLTGDKLAEDNTTNIHLAYSATITPTPGLPITVSFYGKKAEKSVVFTVCSGNNNPRVYFDLNAGTFSIESAGGSDGTLSNAKITTDINGWYKCSFVYTPITSTGFSIAQRLVPAFYASSSYAGNGTDGLYLWGHQMNYGSRVLDYVQTTSAAIYAPRFQYDPVTKKYQGLLMEKGSTNLLAWSEDFNNNGAGVQRASLTVTTDATLAPDGNNTADKLVEANTNSGHAFVSGFSNSSIATYTYSCYFKKAERTDVAVMIQDFTGGVPVANSITYYNLNTGVISATGAASGTISATSATITDAGKGWYRCTFTFTLTAAVTNPRMVIYPSIGTVNSYQGDGASGIYAWGAQLEASAVPTSYIPTLGASVARAEDVCSNTTFANWYNQDEGTMATKFIANNSLDQRMFSVFGGGANEITLRRTGAGFNFVVRDGTNNGDISNGTSIDGQATTVAGAFKVGNSSGSLNGNVSVTANNSVILFAPTTIYLGRNAGGYSHTPVKWFAYFPTKRTDTELQKITQ